MIVCLKLNDILYLNRRTTDYFLIGGVSGRVVIGHVANTCIAASFGLRFLFKTRKANTDFVKFVVHAEGCRKSTQLKVILKFVTPQHFICDTSCRVGNSFSFTSRDCEAAVLLLRGRLNCDANVMKVLMSPTGPPFEFTLRTTGSSKGSSSAFCVNEPMQVCGKGPDLKSLHCSHNMICLSPHKLTRS